MFRRAPQIRNPISNVLEHHIGARIDPPFFDIVLLTPEHFAALFTRLMYRATDSPSFRRGSMKRR